MFRARRVAPLLLFPLLAVPVWAQVGVSPPKMEISIGPTPTTESIRVFNFGTEPTEISVSVHNWDLDEANQVRLLPPSEQSLDQWLVINPSVFEVGPGRSQVVRFSARPRARPEPGEHRAMIYFTDVTTEEIPAANPVRYVLGATIYAHVGDPSRLGTLNGVTVDDRAVWFDVTSAGTAHVRLEGQYAIWTAESYPGAEATASLERQGKDDVAPLPHPGVVASGPLPELPVLPGTRRVQRLDLDRRLEPGKYVLDLNGHLGEARLDRGIPFTIVAEENLAQTPTP